MWAEQKIRNAKSPEQGPREACRALKPDLDSGHMHNWVHMSMGFCDLSEPAGWKINPKAHEREAWQEILSKNGDSRGLHSQYKGNLGINCSIPRGL